MHNIDHTIIASIVVSFLSYCFGVVTPALEFLMWCIILDVILGILASFINPNLMFNSRTLFKGIVKKLVLLSMVAFSKHLDILMGSEIICMTTVYFFIINEGMSVLEEAGKCGINLPPIIKNSLAQLKEITTNEHERH